MTTGNSPQRPLCRDRTCKHFDQTLQGCVQILSTFKMKKSPGGPGCERWEPREESKEGTDFEMGKDFEMETGKRRDADQEEIDLVISMYNAGATSNEIAAKTGRTRAAIDTRLYNLRKKGLVGKGPAAEAPVPAPEDKPQPPTVNKDFDALFEAPAQGMPPDFAEKNMNIPEVGNIPVSTAPSAAASADRYLQAWGLLYRQIDAERDRLKSLCGDGEIEVKGQAGYYIYLAGQRAALNKLRDEAYALTQIFDLGGDANER